MREIKANKTSFKKGHLGMKAEANPNWKGDKAGYGAIHDFMKYMYGLAYKCDVCHVKGKKKYEWACVTGNYTRQLRDWKMMCTSCHRKFDGHAKKLWENRLKNEGKPCTVCGLVIVSKHQLCPVHAKIMYNKRRSIHA